MDLIKDQHNEWQIAKPEFIIMKFQNTKIQFLENNYLKRRVDRVEVLLPIRLPKYSLNSGTLYTNIRKLWEVERRRQTCWGHQ